MNILLVEKRKNKTKQKGEVEGVRVFHLREDSVRSVGVLSAQYVRRYHNM